ncbi:MAG: signal peptide peptidase SppA [Candidatus Magnetoovum sp. WYHC-5]|nr:signal peptide peptidase SppA [Candidatus Magnetoovum sp. WYHC-5]
MKKVCIVFSVLFVVLIIAGIIAAFVEKPLSIGEKVGLIKVEGVIMESEKIIEQLENYRENKSIKAIILRVNSPGGAVSPSQEIYEEVKRIAKVKPVVVSMGSLAASGGYYISAAATKIVATPGTITGSIGVIMEIVNVGGLMEKIGVKSEVITSGKYKDLASVFRGIGEEQRKILQMNMDDIHEQFIEAVALGRKIPVERIREIADGRIFTGRQAQKLSLVDKLGGLQDAINEAAKIANIEGKPQVVTPKDNFNFDEFLSKSMFGTLFQKPGALNMHYMLLPYGNN